MDKPASGRPRTGWSGTYEDLGDVELPPEEQAEAQRHIGPITDQRPKCWRCGRTLGGFFTRPWSLICQKCNAMNDSAEIPEPTRSAQHSN